MKHITRASSAVLAGVTAALLVASPAIAGGPSVLDDPISVGGYSWTIGASPFGVQETSILIGDKVWNDAWDGSSFATFAPGSDFDPESLYPADYSAFDCATPAVAAPDSAGDVVVTCAPMTDLRGLTIDGDMRLYAEGDLARTTYTLTNDTASSLEYGWQFFANYRETVARASSTSPIIGDVDYVDDDLWSYNYHGYSYFVEGPPSIEIGLNGAVAWGIPNSTVNHQTVDSRADNIDDLWVAHRGLNGDVLSLAPGVSVTYVFFQKVDRAGSADVIIIDIGPVPTLTPSPTMTPTPAAADQVVAAEPAADSTVADPAVVSPVTAPDAVDTAALMGEFSTFTGRLVRGLPTGVEIANWGVVPSALAATGPNDAMPLGLAALALLVVGGVIVVNRTANARRAI